MPFVRCLSSCGEERANLAFPRARGRLALRPAPLGNREIAFGCVRLAIRRPCTGPLGWRARSSPRLARARGGFRRASTPPPRIRLHPRGAIHPPLRRAWLGRDASLRQSHPSRRRLAPRGAGFALAPWQARLAPCALSALVRFCGARSAPLTVSKVSALVRNCAENILEFHSVGTCFRLAQSWITMRMRAHLSPKCIHEVSVANATFVPALSWSVMRKCDALQCDTLLFSCQ